MRIYMKKKGTGSLPRGIPQIQGSLAEDSTISIDVSTVQHVHGFNNVTYMWYKDNVQHNTSSSILLTQSDVGSVFRVEMSFTDNLDRSFTVVSDDTTPITNVNDAPVGSVTIIGQPSIDLTVSADVSITDEDGIGAFSYQWNLDGNPILGAVSSTYLIQPGDVDRALTVTASYIDAHGTQESVTSSIVTVSDDLYSFSSHTFTTAGSSTSNPPTLTACRNEYLGAGATWVSNTNNFNIVQSGTQLWTVPITGTYRITARGGKGGDHNISYTGGLGASMRGDFTLTRGTKLKILVGNAGWKSGEGCTGGGGAFVATEANSPLIVAGGGGGAAGNNPYSSGYNATTNTTGSTGSAGQGGAGDSGHSNESGGGGGGFYGNGGSAGASGGYSFVNGGFFANTTFGGGGGQGSDGAGGGGGYSGGHGNDTGGGYGAGSYNNGTNQSNTINNTGPSVITITLL